MLENENDDQIDGQRCEFLVVDNDHEVRDVGVHKLEHVDLVDHGIFMAAHVTMIFVVDKLA